MNWPILILFASMALCFCIRMPISFSMLAASVIYFLTSDASQLTQVFSVINGNTFSNYTMLAAPLFIFMANIMNESEVTDKMFAFCNGLLGKLKGGTAQVNVLLSLIFSGMTGSAIADASGIGTMEIEQMKREGYDAPFSAAITAASATIGPIFPPSIPMIIYAMLSGASVGQLFIGGVVPGVMLAVVLAIYEGASRSADRRHPSRWYLYRCLHTDRGWRTGIGLCPDHLHVCIQNDGMEEALAHHQGVRSEYRYPGSADRYVYAFLLHRIERAGRSGHRSGGYVDHRQQVHLPADR